MTTVYTKSKYWVIGYKPDVGQYVVTVYDEPISMHDVRLYLLAGYEVVKSRTNPIWKIDSAGL